MELIKADTSYAEAVASIYDEVRNGELCVWSEHYPTLEHALDDAKNGCLYVLTDGGNSIGCASVEPVAEDDDLPFWSICDGNHREVSRVAVRPEYRGKGYARTIMAMLIKELEASGVSSVHLLAAKKNIPAVKTYKEIGFGFIGDCFRYGADYYVCEKILER